MRGDAQLLLLSCGVSLLSVFFRILPFFGTPVPFGRIVLRLRFGLVGADAPRRGHIPSGELLLARDPANRHEAQNQSLQDEERTQAKRCVASVVTWTDGAFPSVPVKHVLVRGYAICFIIFLFLFCSPKYLADVRILFSESFFNHKFMVAPRIIS